MIATDAEPVSHKSPYQPIDIAHPGRKQIITFDQWFDNGCGREPDPAAYRYDFYRQAWVLKD